MNAPREASLLDPGRAPDFILAGVAKSGSTSLANYLGQHPAVFMTTPKEPNYFRTDDAGLRYHDLDRRQPWRPRRHQRTAEWYQSLFKDAHPDQRRGEASIGYLRGGRSCASRIKAAAPAVRLVFILRQPAEQAYSAYVHMRRRGDERFDFAQGLAMEARRKEVPMADMFLYRENCRYHERLAGFYEVFGAGAIKVLLYDDWADPAALVGKVLRFVGVEHPGELNMTARENVGVVPVLGGLQRRLSPERSWAWRRVVGEAGWRRAKALLEWARRINLRPPPPLDPVLRRQLTEECREDIEKTQALIGRDLSRWLET